jgi:hypothetical protein
VDVEAELVEPVVDRLSFIIGECIEYVRQHVHDVLVDHLKKLREVRRVVAVDVDVVVDRLEDLHEHECLRYRDDEEQSRN